MYIYIPSIAITNTSGHIYWCNTGTYDFAEGFASNPRVFAQTYGGTTNCWIWGYSTNDISTTKTPKFYLARGTSATGSIGMHVMAIGKPKTS